MNNEVDVVVVGGGLGGLSVAALTSRAGLRTAVLERASSLGGRAATTVRDGFHLNLGGHALYRNGPAEHVLTELGIDVPGARPLTSGGVIMADGEPCLLPSSLGTLLRTGLLSAREKLEFAQLLRRLPKIDLAPLENVPLSEWLVANTSDSRVRPALLTLVRVSTYANAPGALSAAAAFRQLRLAGTSGVLYVDHGWQTLVDRLAASARKSGTTVDTSAHVRSVTAQSRGWRVDLGDGASWVAAAVVLATGPRAAAKVARGQGILETWAESTIPVSAACLDVGLSSLPNPRMTFALGLESPLYFSVHSGAARLAPAGSVLVHTMKYIAPGEEGRHDEHARELEAWLDLCQPGWREVLLTKRFLAEMVATNDLTRAKRGRRPGPAVPGAPGLYVVGDWVGEEGMLADASFASARRAALSIQERAAPLLSAAG
jgi:phytoene dehydrogenase-like protein